MLSCPHSPGSLSWISAHSNISQVWDAGWSRPAHRFWGDLCPGAAMGQLSGICGDAGAPHAALSRPNSAGTEPRGSGGAGAWLHVAVTPSQLFQLREATRYFWHAWAPRGARGSAPSRSSAGTSQAVPGGGDASVAAFPEQVLARRAAGWGVEGEVSPWIWGSLSVSESCTARFVLCGCRGAPWGTGEGPDWHLGGFMFSDGHPRDAGRCWALGGSVVPAWRCSWLTRGEMSSSHWAETSDLLL